MSEAQTNLKALDAPTTQKVAAEEQHMSSEAFWPASNQIRGQFACLGGTKR